MGVKAILEDLPLYERRKRVKRPPSLMLFGLLFLVVLPAYNYLGLAILYGEPWSRPGQVLGRIHIIEAALLFCSILVGIGLLRVRTWGWWLLLVYASVLISYNVLSLISAPVGANASAAIQTAVLFAAVYYFLRRDIAAPYMKLYPRGWRFHKRYPLQIPVHIGDREITTRDFSDRGFYVKWPDVDLAPGRSVTVTFALGGREYQCEAGVASVIPGHGVGFAFRGLSADDAATLGASLRDADQTRPDDGSDES